MVTHAVYLVSLTMAMVVAAGSRQPQASAKNSSKLLQIEGQVSVNGAAAIPGATISSDSTVTIAHATPYPTSKFGNMAQWGPAAVSATQAWEVTQGDNSVVIAIVETGAQIISMKKPPRLKTPADV